MAAIHSSLISPNAKTPLCTLWRPRAGAREITKKRLLRRWDIRQCHWDHRGSPLRSAAISAVEGSRQCAKVMVETWIWKGFLLFLLGWRQGEGSKTYCYLFQTSNSSNIRLWGVEFHLFPGKQPNLPCYFFVFFPLLDRLWNPNGRCRSQNWNPKLPPYRADFDPRTHLVKILKAWVIWEGFTLGASSKTKDETEVGADEVRHLTRVVRLY